MKKTVIKDIVENFKKALDRYCYTGEEDFYKACYLGLVNDYFDSIHTKTNGAVIRAFDGADCPNCKTLYVSPTIDEGDSLKCNNCSTFFIAVKDKK